jgi:hypothetical protein
MDCKRGWSSEFMAANFPLIFRNDVLRKHRRKILLEREKAMLPAMQIFVEYKRNMEKYTAEMEKIRLVFGNPYNTYAATPEIEERMKKTTSYRYILAKRERDGTRVKGIKIDADIAHLKLTLSQPIDDEYSKKQIPPMDGDPTVAKHYEYLNKKNDERAEIVSKKREVWAASDELRGLRIQREAVKKRLDEITEPFKIIEKEYLEQSHALNDATNGMMQNMRLYNGEEQEGRQRREFIMKCADEECRGFLSSSYKCGTCEKWTCSQCLVVVGKDKDVPHTCDPNTVETAKTIKTETHPCPKCGTRIFKIDGCDQMWCVMEGCGTAFSWNSGHVVTGAVHNPHYYEWLRRTGGATREIADIPCGGLPAVIQLIQALRTGYIPPDTRNTLMEIHRNIRELIEMRLRDYPARPPALANKDIDVSYLMNKITEVEWQRHLELDEAKFIRKKEIGQILQTLATAGADLMNYIVNQSIAMDPALYATWVSTAALEQLEQLRIFCNDSLKNLAKRDRMAVPQFEGQWKWKGVRALYRPAKVKAEV